MPPKPRPPRALNINVGVLGHVDCGKTSLVKALSTTLSTAALDKHPQSAERGITLDLGFSSLASPLPAHIAEAAAAQGYEEMQLTLVDCPGHASLIRTIIGGASIIDMIMLVVDCQKLVQAQTAECLVIGEITSNNLLIVLNKIDVFPEAEREERVARATRRLRRTLAHTKFADAPVVPVAVAVGGEKAAAVDRSGGGGVRLAQQLAAARVSGESGEGAEAAATTDDPEAGVGAGETLNLDALLDALRASVRLPERDAASPFLFSVDHCFPIRGHGTVMTGTVLQGSVAVNHKVLIPALGLEKKVKSMQMFRRPVKRVQQGDRVGICVSGVDPSAIERALVAAPGAVVTCVTALALVRKIRYFRGACDSQARFHVTIGHSTVMATATFFGAGSVHVGVEAEAGGAAVAGALGTRALDEFPAVDFDFAQEFAWQERLAGAERKADEGEGEGEGDGDGEEGGAGAESENGGLQWALLEMQVPTLCAPHSMLIGSRLDVDEAHTGCRLAFYGRLVHTWAPSDASPLPRLRLFRTKVREGQVDRLSGDAAADGSHALIIVRGLFTRETDLSKFIGLRVHTEHEGEEGVIQSAFGKSGKVKVSFRAGTAAAKDERVFLRFKRFVYDGERAMVQ